MPRLQKQDTPYMTAYQTLEDRRKGGLQGPEPIAVSEIESYCNLARVNDPRERLKHLRLVGALDRLYLEHWAENRPKA